MRGERRSIKKTMVRCLRLRCPACGQSSILQRRFQVRHHCPACKALFQREAGFFVGAIVVNIVTTELLIILVYVACLLFISSHYDAILTILFILGLGFPVAFYQYSWSIWLGLDYLIESLPKHVEPAPEANGDSRPNGRSNRP